MTGPTPPDEPGHGSRDVPAGALVSASTGTIVHLAALAGLVVGLQILALPGVRDRWPVLPLVTWLVTSAGLVGLWLWWPRRRELARRRAETGRARGIGRSGDTDWTQLPLPLAVILFPAAAATTILVAAMFLVFLAVAVPGVPLSVVWPGAGAAAVAWLGVFVLWLWWPERRRLAARRRRRRREARRRLAAIRSSGAPDRPGNDAA